MKKSKKQGSKHRSDVKVLHRNGNGESCNREDSLEASLVDGLADIYQTFQPLLRAIARKYRSVSFEDAYQEACVALLKAVQQYDPELGVPLSAYVAVKVRGDVRTAMRRWWTYERRVTSPDVRDDESPNEVWDTVMVDGSAGTGKVNPYRDCDTWMDIRSADLSPRERLSVLAVLEGWSSSEVALAYGVSPETVKTWRKRALRKLRNALREDE